MVFFAEPEPILGGALFSPDRKHRTMLWRWGQEAYTTPLKDARRARDQEALQISAFQNVKTPYILFVGHNPSTADHKANDPTVRREFDRSRGDGYLLYIKMNVSSFISTDPRGLTKAVLDQPDNCAVLVEAAKRAKTIVLAMGIPHDLIQYAAMACIDTIEDIRQDDPWEVKCFGLTKQGWPRHPLYLKTGTPLVAFNKARKEMFSGG